MKEMANHPPVGTELYSGDCIEIMRTFPADSFDLVFGSPPYCDARTYGIGAQRNCVEWVSWMLEVTTEAARVCRGPVVWIADGVVRKRAYQPACEGLMWEAYKSGLVLERPLVWHSNKTPSRQREWWSHAWEHVLAFKRPGKVPHFDPTVCAERTKFATSGNFRQRRADGQRKIRRKDYVAPEFSSPRDVLRVSVGGGHMGSALAHQNEAPFPEKLAEIFVRSLCPEGGLVVDPFIGSGTTAAVCKRWGRRCIGVDLRQSQIELTRRRLAQQQFFSALELTHSREG